MPTFVTGEYLNEKLAPQLLREYKDNNADFLSAIPNSPEEAITDEGLKLMVIKEVDEAVINPGADFLDADVVSEDHDKALIPWDYISTKPRKVTKDQLRAAVYDKRSEIRVQQNRVLMRKQRDYTLHSLAPVDNTNSNLPVLVTTGSDIAGVRKRLRVEDLMNYQSLLRDLNIPEEGWHLRLCNEHILDLLLDTKENQDFRSMYHNHVTGKPLDLYGFTIWLGNHKTYYASDLTKKALGAVKAATDQNASIFWLEENVYKAMGMVTVHLDPMSQNTRSNPPKEEFRITAYLHAGRKQEIATGSIVSDNLAE